jgi:hypothetical protein
VNLAGIAKDDGHLTDAVDWYEKACEIYRDLGDDSKAANFQAEIDRVRATASDLVGGEGPENEGRTVTGISTEPLWVGLWHLVGLRGARSSSTHGRNSAAGPTSRFG